MRAVDTNILVRFLTRDDPSQSTLARSILLGGDIWISKTVLLETEWVLRGTYQFTHTAVLFGLKQLLGLPGLTLEHAEGVAGALALFETGVDFADALHVASSPRGVEFLTFDKALSRRAKHAGVVKT